VRLSKFIQDPKGYSKKKIKSSIKTVKSQPFSLAAGLLGIMSEMADNHNAWESSEDGTGGKEPTSNLLHVLGQGAQLWANAKGARKASEHRHEIARIVGDNSLSDDDKYTLITQLGDHKTASSIKQRDQFTKTLGLSKDKFEETKRQNRIGNDQNDRSYTFGVKKHEDDQGLTLFGIENSNKNQEQNREAGLVAALVKSLGKIGAQGKMDKQDFIDILNNPGKIEGIDTHNGKINKITGSTRTTMTPATTLTPEQVRVFKDWKRKNRR
jgi:hypothetical protein